MSRHQTSKKTRIEADGVAMDAVQIPADNVPEAFKACEQILRRGKEVKKVEPVIAYWCCFSAAQKAIKVANRSKSDTAFLMSLLDALEEMKAILATNDAVINEAAGAAYVENFALKVFMSADNEDRNGTTGKATIRKFVVAGQFIEVLRCFENGMTEEKLQYARWKAADGAKALREGREPTSGPPIPDIEPALPELPSGSPSLPPVSDAPPSDGRTPVVSPRPSPAQNGRTNLPSLDTQPHDRAPQRTNSTASGAWSTVATPGIPDDSDIPARFNLPPTPPSTHIDPPGGPPVGDRKNVRFMGPDGAPLSPAQTHFTVDSYDAPDAPPPTEFGAPPAEITPPPPASSVAKDDHSSSSRSTNPSSSSGTTSNPNGSNGASSRSRGDSHSSITRPSVIGASPIIRNITPTAAPGASGSARASPSPHPQNPPPAPPPSLAAYPSQPSHPPHTAHPGGLGLTSPPPSAPPLASSSPLPSSAHLPPAQYAPAGPPPKLTRKQVEQTQKHARWAISALEFDDTETARKELRSALALLGG